MANVIAGSQTEKNLLIAFAGESQARNRYSYFAGQARKEGFLQIAQIFETTAEQERMHAKRYFKFLEGGELEITWKYPAGIVGTTQENLIAAAAGEHFEWTEMYPGFAEIAQSEGFNNVAKAFEMICVAEKHHEERYLKLLDLIEKNRVFQREHEVSWQCSKCGFIHKGSQPPEKCPACLHPKSYYILLSENF